MRKTLAFFFPVFLMALLALPRVQAQGFGAAKQHVDWTAEVQPETAAPGETARLVLRAEIAEGWKMYAMDSPPPTRGVSVTLETLPAPLSHAQDFAQSAPTESYDPFFEKEVRFFKNAATLRTGLAVSADAGPDRHEIGGTITFMICNPEKCLPPTDKRFSATLDVAAGAESGGGG